MNFILKSTLLTISIIPCYFISEHFFIEKFNLIPICPVCVDVAGGDTLFTMLN